MEAARTTPEEAEALELLRSGEVTRISRVLLLDGEAAAWMIDVLPADVIPAGKVTERLSSHQMVLDLLLDEGIAVAFSEVEVSGTGNRAAAAGLACARVRPLPGLCSAG